MKGVIRRIKGVIMLNATRNNAFEGRYNKFKKTNNANEMRSWANQGIKTDLKGVLTRI